MRHAATAARPATTPVAPTPSSPGRPSSGRHAVRDERDGRTVPPPVDARRSSTVGMVAGLLVAGLAASFAGAAPVGTTSTTSTSSSSSSSSSSSDEDGAYLGETPLGCSVYRMRVGDVRATETTPYCTQMKLAERFCDLELTDRPTVGVAGRTTSATWTGSAGSVQSYTYPDEHMFLCSDYSTGAAHRIVFADDEWSDLISVGTLSPTLSSRIATA